MSQNDHIISLIAKQLQGVATPEEAKELQQWLHSDAACQQEYDEMARIWQKSGPILANPEFNTDIAWAKLNNKASQINPRPQQQFHTIISYLFSKKAAVAVVLFAMVAIGGFYWYKQSQWQTFTAANKNETLTLPDQSVVLVRKGSSVKYLRSFEGKERRVQLTGEAFFKVQPNKAKPFIVITDNADVKVLGTSFLVNSDAVAVQVVVVTGKVNVTYKYTVEENNQITLNKGQQALLYRGRFHQSSVADSNFMAWNTGQLVFNNTAFSKVLEDISHFYQTRVELDPNLQSSAASIQITVEFKDQPLEQVLDELKLITGFSLKKEKDKVVFYRN
jgi:transmembrane sensor